MYFIHNYFGNYSFAWKSERVVSFDALYWRRLKTVNWLFDKNIQTGTIHSFQGDECHIIICLFNPPPNISRSPNAFLNKQNILNVAISRAKDYLILLIPNDETANIDNLYQLQRLRGILKYYLSGVSQYYKASDIEEIILGQPDYIYENSFVTTHQNVNVYTEQEKKYEIRIDDSVIDIQVNLGI